MSAVDKQIWAMIEFEVTALRNKQLAEGLDGKDVRRLKDLAVVAVHLGKVSPAKEDKTKRMSTQDLLTVLGGEDNS